MHSRAILMAVSSAVGDCQLSEQRFRSNIAIDGSDAWEEQRCLGRKIQIGRINFEVVTPKSRCLAKQVNPSYGERDLPILKTPAHAFSQLKPTFVVALLTRDAGGAIHVADKESLLN